MNFRKEIADEHKRYRSWPLKSIQCEDLMGILYGRGAFASGFFYAQTTSYKNMYHLVQKKLEWLATTPIGIENKACPCELTLAGYTFNILKDGKDRVNIFYFQKKLYQIFSVLATGDVPIAVASPPLINIRRFYERLLQKFTFKWKNTA